jgi:polysaccharide deacetylase 2 family uncharacterized protein YibQ
LGRQSVVRNAFWLTIIAASALAIGAGFFQASLTTHPPPLVRMRGTSRSTPQPLVAQTKQSGALQTDAFAFDDVVVQRPRSDVEEWRPARLAVVVAICGYSVVAESQWVRIGLPFAFVVDPTAPNAVGMASLVRDAGDGLFVQLDAPPTASQLIRLHLRLGAFDGVASREATGMARALRGSGLTFLDERGDRAVASEFARNGVRLLQRDVTADDLSAPGYIAFMLGQASAISRRIGPAIVLVRPLPATLSALRTFASSHAVRMVSLH